MAQRSTNLTKSISFYTLQPFDDFFCTKAPNRQKLIWQLSLYILFFISYNLFQRKNCFNLPFRVFARSRFIFYKNTFIFQKQTSKYSQLSNINSFGLKNENPWEHKPFFSVYIHPKFLTFCTLQVFAGIYRDFARKSECRDFKFMGIACIPAIPVIFEVNKKKCGLFIYTLH